MAKDKTLYAAKDFSHSGMSYTQGQEVELAEVGQPGVTETAVDDLVKRGLLTTDKVEPVVHEGDEDGPAAGSTGKAATPAKKK